MFYAYYKSTKERGHVNFPTLYFKHTHPASSDRIVGVIVSSVVDHGFEHWSGQLLSLH